MRALDCECGHHLEAEDDERLVAAGTAHAAEAHAELNIGEEQMRELVRTRAYDV